MWDTYADWQLSQLSPQKLGLEASYDYSHRQPENKERWEAEETLRREASSALHSAVASLSRMIRQAIVREKSDQNSSILPSQRRGKARNCRPHADDHYEEKIILLGKAARV